jgi:hypothetical protein
MIGGQCPPYINYKFMFGTPDLDSGEGRQQVAELNNFDTYQEAMLAALAEEMGDN